MKIKLIYHLMPWEIDYALLSFTQLKKSKYYIPDNVEVIIDTTLNLSSHLIDWDETKLPKQYFIEKYNTISLLLSDYDHNKKIYDDTQLYGCLDLVRESYDNDIDYYVAICPDMYFHEHLLTYLIQAAQEVSNEYFVITPQICRLWDETWEILTHPKFAVGPHYGWQNTIDIFDVDYFLRTAADPVKLTPIAQHKWAGWFDLYSKKFYEDMVTVPKDWVGYGAWDAYGMAVTTYARQRGYDFQQYRLDGQIVFEYGVGPLRNDTINGFSNYYKNLIVCKDVSEQRDAFNSNLNRYIQDKINEL